MTPVSMHWRNLHGEEPHTSSLYVSLEKKGLRDYLIVAF